MGTYISCAVERFDEKTNRWTYCKTFTHLSCATRDVLYKDLYCVANMDITLSFNDYCSIKNLTPETTKELEGQGASFDYSFSGLRELVDKLSAIKASLKKKRKKIIPDDDKELFSVLGHTINELTYMLLYCTYEHENCPDFRFIFYISY